MGTGFKWSRPYLQIKAGDYVLWKWSSPDLVTGLNFKVGQVDDPGSTTQVANGFDSGDATPSGSYLYQFNNAGTYYYWSGLVDSQEISFRGVIQVQAVNKFVNEPSIKVKNFQGKYLF